MLSCTSTPFSNLLYIRVNLQIDCIKIINYFPLDWNMTPPLIRSESKELWYLKERLVYVFFSHIS